EVPDRAVGRPRHPRRAPRLAAVLRQHDVADPPRRPVADAQQHALRPADHLRHAAAVRARRLLANIELPPAVAVVVAEVQVVVGRGQQPAPPAARRHDHQAVDVRRAEAAGLLDPAPAAIIAAPGAVDLDAGPGAVALRGQGGDARADDARAGLLAGA